MSCTALFHHIEYDRLDAHFDWVLVLLRAQPVKESTNETQTARERTLTLVEKYARRRKFPRNRGRTDRLVPVFVDEAGTTCAVAQLLLDTGEPGLVDAIQRTMNRAYVEEMQSADLSAWATSVGLTPDEVALIQPAYCGESKTPTGCSYKYNPCGDVFNDAGCECVPQTKPDGTHCELTPPSACNGGLCQSGGCADPVDACATPADAVFKKACEPYTACVAEENNPPTHGCTCALGANPSSAGAPAALFAALFLGALVRRRYRASAPANRSRTGSPSPDLLLSRRPHTEPERTDASA